MSLESKIVILLQILSVLFALSGPLNFDPEVPTVVALALTTCPR